MLTGSIERLARWTASLDARIQAAEAELARPLCSPWLRCACGVFQSARLALVMKEGVMIAAVGVSLILRTAQAGNIPNCAQAVRSTTALARTTARAGLVLLRAIYLAVSSGRVALLATGENKHERV